jgi:oligopeptide transport system substrate-binding protein
MMARTRMMAAARGLALCAVFLVGCSQPWNDPYPASQRGRNIFYTVFTDRPKTLDPARSYTSDEWDFLEQVYEPPLQYHYLKRPYELVPLAASEMPTVRYYDTNNVELRPDVPVEQIAYTDYEIHIRPGVLYQPHPAFVRDSAGKPLYLGLSEEEVKRHRVLADFPQTGTRELTADDYVYETKRLALPRLNSPILGHLSEYIVGLRELGERLNKDYQRLVADYQARYGEADPGYPWLDLRDYDLSGVKVIDRYTYRIRVKGKYQQFEYWLAMPFFAPVPVEADQFYAQRGMNDGRNINMDWYPVGTGAFMLSENNPNARMVLDRNPNFRGEAYPEEGAPGDREAGLLADAGKRGPFLDRVVFSRDKEAIPLWNKFLQGYYDISGIASDNFDQAVRVSLEGQATLSDEMQQKGIRLETSVATSTFYFAFNFLDPVVGGLSERAKKLRQAISITMDWEEFISIFANGRGIPGMGPIPPGIFGFQEGRAGINPVVYDWVDGAAHRKPIAEAQRLLAEAGFPDGRDAASGAPLVLYLDTVSNGPGDKPRLDWYRRQFDKLHVQLEIRETDWNRFQDKILHGRTQLFFLGWNADYPDPENFMFLLYGPNARAHGGGENAANYSNPAYDELFQKMKNLPNGPERQELIDRMVALLREDAPWVWGFHPKDYSLLHQWVSNVKPSHLERNGLKFYRVDAAVREEKRLQWNHPVVWPVVLAVALLVLSAIPAWWSYRRRELSAAR